MNTYLLTWNPFFSSYKTDYMRKDFGFEDCEGPVLLGDELPVFTEGFGWSIADFEDARPGDLFFFVKVGYDKPAGIIGSGYLTGDPYEDEDWAGQETRKHYVDIQFDVLIDPESESILKRELLDKELPHITWYKGHSGKKLSEQDALKLEALWADHLRELGIETD